MRYTNYILHGHPVQCEQLGVVAAGAVFLVFDKEITEKAR